MEVYKSLIGDFEIVAGDSSATYFIGSRNSQHMKSHIWTARLIISSVFGGEHIVNRELILNDGSMLGDNYEVGTKFVVQILPQESILLEGGKKYVGTVELTCANINYNREVARFKIKVLHNSN